MASPEELEERVRALECQMAEARHDAAAARVLAGAADRDVSEFRQILDTHTRLLNALRETQIEHHAETRALQAKVETLEGKVEAFQTEMVGFQAETRDGFAKVNIGMVHITGLLETLIDRDAT